MLKLKSDIFSELGRASIEKKNMNDVINLKCVYILDAMEDVKQLDQITHMKVFPEFEKCVADVEDTIKSLV